MEGVANKVDGAGGHLRPASAIFWTTARELRNNFAPYGTVGGVQLGLRLTNSASIAI